MNTLIFIDDTPFYYREAMPFVGQLCLTPLLLGENTSFTLVISIVDNNCFADHCKEHRSLLIVKVNYSVSEKESMITLLPVKKAIAFILILICD